MELLVAPLPLTITPASSTSHKVTIEGDDIACARLRATDGRVRGFNADARGIAQRLRACNVGANDVALDNVAGPGNNV